MEALAGEFLTYLFKFVVLLIIAVAGVMVGIKYKKSKLSKEAATAEETAEVE